MKHHSELRLLPAFLSVTGCLLFAPCAHAEADLGVSDFRVFRTSVETLTYPDQVYFTLVNYGPSANCDVLLDFILSRNGIAGDVDDLPLASFVHSACLDPWTGVYDTLSTAERTHLTLPADASGDYYVFLRVTPAWDTDPDLSDNLTVATNRLNVPKPGSIYAVFANSSVATSNMTIYPGGYFAYNAYYGNCWRLLNAGGGFTGTFTAAHAGTYKLRVRHGTSASSSCPGGGHAPVNIFINGATVAADYDVNANHDSFWFEDDTWTIQVNEGENTLEWTAGGLCTHYWIQRIEITAAEQPPMITRFSRHGGGEARVEITGQAGRTNVIEFSEDLLTWTSVTNLYNSIGWLEWTSPVIPSAQGFYRVLELAP